MTSWPPSSSPFDESGGKAGPYTLRLRTLAGKTLSDNARAAIADQSTIAYLGELVPGTSEVSVEIVNQQGLLEVSPLDTAAYLTQPVPPVSNSVQTFYPGHATYHETFARVVPTSAQEARALVAEMQSEHVSSLYVADDGQRYGATLALEVRSAAKPAGLTVSGSLGSAQGAFFGGSPASAAGRAAALTSSIRPRRRARASSCSRPRACTTPGSRPRSAPPPNSAWSSPRRASRRASCRPPASAFTSAFTSAYHHAPAPQAVFGYEAMKAVIAVLQSAGASAASRAAVVTRFRSLKRTGTGTR